MQAKKEMNIHNFDYEVSDNFELDKTYKSSGNLVFSGPKITPKSSGTVTKIIVNDKNGDEEISKKQLANYINSNKKLNSIVIEELNVSDVKRTNLIFDKKKSPKNITHSDYAKVSRTVEKSINAEFFRGGISGGGHSLKNDFIEAINGLKISEDENPVYSNLSLADEVKEVSFKRQELKRKNNKSLSKLYYKVKNHIELFKLGDSYLRDFNRGIKSLAFNSFENKTEREKTVLGVTSFLNYNAKVTVTVVTDSIEKSLYHSQINDLEEIKKPILNEDIAYTCYVTQGVEFVEFSELCNVMYQLGNTSFEDFVEYFVENSDVVLWDLPELLEMDNKKELFYPVIRSIESISLIVKSNSSKYKDIYKIKDYFDKYKVPSKGFVLSP